MKDIPDGSIDAVICDPPYGKTACKWDTIIPFEPMWEQLKRVTKKNAAIVLFGSQPFASAMIMSNPSMFKYECIWEKSNPSNIALANKQPMRYHENLLCFYNSQCTYNKQMIPRDSPRISQAQSSGYSFHNSQSEQTGLKHIEVCSSKYDAKLKNPSSIIKVNSLRPNAKEFVKHPTQKPVALMEYLIKTYTNEGETILDFAAGSCTTGVACVNLNRNYILIEKERKYCDIGENRIRENNS